jgi:hypothetical protein
LPAHARRRNPRAILGGILRRAATALALLGMALGGSALGACPAVADPTPAPPQVIDGPSSALGGPVDLGTSVARDGSGGIVYEKQVAGVEHVFVSALQGGSFQPPQRVDGTLAGPSSQAVIASNSGGQLVVAFVNGGGLYVAQRSSVVDAFSPPRRLATGASNPSLDMTTFGKAYIAFTTAAGSGHDIRAAYYRAGTWALESAPLNAVAAGDAAGTGSARPAVAAANDGVAIVAWGEGGHVYTRRVWGTSPSVVFEQADGPIAGCTDVSADEPAIGSGGDSSYAAVAFHESVSCSGQPQSRVLVNRLHGSVYDGIRRADGLTAGTGAADAPSVAIGEMGNGWVTADQTGSDALYALSIGNAATPGSGAQVNTLGNTSAPYAVPAIAGQYASFVAWQQDPGTAGAPDIRLRYAARGNVLGHELVLSSPDPGPTDAAAGLAAAGDNSGDGAVAWVQGTTAGNEVVVAQLYEPPAPPSILSPTDYVRDTTPKLRWAPGAGWGPIHYTVSVDGIQVAQTAGSSTTLSSPASQGLHSWQVTAGDPAGLTASDQASFFVDTIAPQATLQLTGTRRAGSALRLHVSATDAPPPLPAGDASGVASVVVHWGDASKPSKGHNVSHVYRRAGRYVITVVVGDWAGNVTRVTHTVRVLAARVPQHGTRRQAG